MATAIVTSCTCGATHEMEVVAKWPTRWLARYTRTRPGEVLRASLLDVGLVEHRLPVITRVRNLIQLAPYFRCMAFHDTLSQLDGEWAGAAALAEQYRQPHGAVRRFFSFLQACYLMLWPMATAPGQRKITREVA
jgi:hypothetical protein